MSLVKGTAEYEVERVRLYIARAILDEIRGKSITPEKTKEIASDVLAFTSGVTDVSQLDGIMDKLVEKYPLLEPARVKNLSYEEEQARMAAATRVTELLKQGKLEEAGDLAHAYNEGGK